MPHHAVHALDGTRLDDFFALHHADHGLGWCCCVAWEVPTWQGWGDRTAAQNEALRRELFAAGRFDGYLLYADEQPVGWCQCGPRDRWPKLTSAHGLAPDPEVYAVTCFALAPAVRKRGLAHLLLSAVLDDLRRQGVPRVEAFPRCGTHEDGEVWTGPEALFRRAGFEAVRRDERGVAVYRLALVR